MKKVATRCAVAAVDSSACAEASRSASDNIERANAWLCRNASTTSSGIGARVVSGSMGERCSTLAQPGTPRRVVLADDRHRDEEKFRHGSSGPGATRLYSSRRTQRSQVERVRIAAEIVCPPAPGHEA